MWSLWKPQVHSVLPNITETNSRFNSRRLHHFNSHVCSPRREAVNVFNLDLQAVFRKLHPDPAREVRVFSSPGHEHEDQIPARGQERIGGGGELPELSRATRRALRGPLPFRWEPAPLSGRRANRSSRVAIQQGAWLAGVLLEPQGVRGALLAAGLRGAHA